MTNSKKRFGTQFLPVAAFAMMALTAPAHADWRDDWKAFADKTGEPGHKAWAQQIATPEAKSLDAAWKAFRGYDANTLMAAGNIPAQLKPGLIITAQNIGSMPWINNYLPGFWRTRLGNPWYGIQQIRIVPTSHYYMSAPVLAATKKLDPASLKINENGELIGPGGGLFMATTGGLPFTKPKNGIELNYLQMAHGVGMDDLHFNPVTMTACNSSNTAERTYVGQIWWRKVAGRTENPPLGTIKSFNGAQEAGALLFSSPRDVRGLAGVRIRYPGVNRDDDFKLFIPTLRRTRTLTGTNGQDPLAAGLEFAWDEWRSLWSKTDAKRFDYKLAGETFLLVQPETGHAYNPLKLSANTCQPVSVDLELRPVWILEITDKTGTYQYKRQRVFIDKELYYTQYKEMFDRSDRLLRAWDDARDFDASTGKSSFINVIIANVNAKRTSYLEFKTDWKNVGTNDSLFDIDQLRNR
jgi:hypothetical protein